MLVRRAFLLIASLVACPAAFADSRGTIPRSIPGPVTAEVVRVIDGDTVEVEAHPWPDHALRIAVRLRGVDTPELRSKCPAFRAAAQQAKITLAAMIRPGDPVELRNISGGKYYGRVVADLSRADENLGAVLIAKGLAVAYDGGRRSKPACPAT